MEVGRVALQLDGPSDVLDGEAMPARLEREDSQKMQRVGLIRHDGEDLSIYLFGGLQAARPMMLGGDRQNFGKRCHDSHYGDTDWRLQSLGMVLRHREIGLSLLHEAG